MSEGKIVIAGPDERANSLLLELLTVAGLDTGFTPGERIDVAVRTAFPYPAESVHAPRVVGDAGLAARLVRVLEVDGLDVDHLLLPMPALDVAVAHEVRGGGYLATAAQERLELAVDLYDLLHTIARFEVPHTLLLGPRFACDPTYLAEQLEFLGLSQGAWQRALDRLGDRDDTEHPLSPRERTQTIWRSSLHDVTEPVERVVHRGISDISTLLTARHAARAHATEPDVTVFVASINTRHATELTIRSMREYAGYPFDLVVGDCGSTDGSLDLLRALENRDWLSLEVAPEGRMHADWLDRWREECKTRFAIFVDSDIEFLQSDWLCDLVDAATNNDAALVCAQIQPGRLRFVHPTSGAKRTLGSRPAPWLLLLDLSMLRGKVDESFHYQESLDPEAFGGKRAYDVGGAFFAALRDQHLGWLEMPQSFRQKFHHFSGLSWRRLLDMDAPMRFRPGQVRRVATVYLRLLRARALRFGEGPATHYRG